MLSTRSHIFHDKENLIIHKTPAHARYASSSSQHQQQGFKTVGRAPMTVGGKMIDGRDKLTMTTRTGKGGEKKAGKGEGAEEGGLIEPKRLFGTTKTNSSTPYVQPSLSLSLSTNMKPSKPAAAAPSLSLSASLSVPPPPSHLKTPARPTSSKSNSTPLPSAGRTRRRSMKLHSTPIKDVTFSTPVGPRMVRDDLSFEMDEPVGAELGLDEVVEEGDEMSGDEEIEYMPPTAILEPFSLPYDCIDAKTLGAQLRRMPLYIPNFDSSDEDELNIPDVMIELQEGGGLTSYDLPVRDIESSDDEFNLNLSRRPRAPASISSRPAASKAPSSRLHEATLPSRRPLPLSTTAPSTVRSTATRPPVSSSSSLRRPLTSTSTSTTISISTSASRPSAPSTLRSATTLSSRTPLLPPPSSSTIRKSISSAPSSTLPPSARRPLPATSSTASSSSSITIRRPLSSTATSSITRATPVTSSTTRSRPALPSSFTSSAAKVAAPKSTRPATVSKAEEDAMFPSNLDSLDSLLGGPDSFLVDDKAGMFEL